MNEKPMQTGENSNLTGAKHQKQGLFQPLLTVKELKNVNGFALL
jgi:hypothetical protein